MRILGWEVEGQLEGKNGLRVGCSRIELVPKSILARPWTILELFCVDFGAFWEVPGGPKLSSKKHKLPSRRKMDFWLNFEHFWGPCGYQKTWFRYVFYNVSSTSAFLQLKWSSRVLKWVRKTQKSLQKWFKNRSKMESKNDREREPLPESIFDDFGAIWDPQNRPKIDQNGWHSSGDCVFDLDLDEFLTSTTFLIDFDPIWTSFGPILSGFWTSFLTILGPWTPLWTNFGSISDQILTSSALQQAIHPTKITKQPIIPTSSLNLQIRSPR